MTSEDIIKELWSLANVIAGFSVAQSVAFAVALGTNLGDLQGKRVWVKIVLSIVCIVFAGAYSFGVYRCRDLALSAEKSHEFIWQQVTYGRIASIWLFTAVPVFGLFARNIFGK